MVNPGAPGPRRPRGPRGARPPGTCRAAPPPAADARRSHPRSAPRLPGRRSSRPRSRRRSPPLSATTPRRPGSASFTRMTPPRSAGCPKRWAAVWACSTTTATAGSTSTPSQGGALSDQSIPLPESQRDRLFRNKGDGDIRGRHRAPGLAAMPGGYGHGVAVGDYRQRRPA